MTREELVRLIGRALDANFTVEGHTIQDTPELIADLLMRHNLVTVSEPFTPRPGLVCKMRLGDSLKSFETKVRVIGEVTVPVGADVSRLGWHNRWLVQEISGGPAIQDLAGPYTGPPAYGAIHIVKAEELEAVK